MCRNTTSVKHNKTRCSAPSMDPVAAHGRHLLQQLHEQRIQGLLCDCTLVVRGVCFKAHKSVLAAFSQHFRSLFQNSSGQKNDVFHLDIKNVSGIGQILDFMYTSHLDLSRDNVQVMLDIAQCLQVQNVLHLCHTFLKSAPVEQPPGTPCSSAFPLQSALAPDTSCVAHENYSPHLLQECAAEVEPSKVLSEPPSQAPLPGHLHAPAGETLKPAPDALDSSCTELPFRQPSYYHKLRNLYSKQYYRQATCPSQERVIEQPFAVSPSTALTAAEHQPCAVTSAVSHAECALPPTEHSPSSFLAQPLSEPAPDPESDSMSQQPTKQMRLKKAIHLKKLNFLKSQKPAEQTPEPRSDEGLARSDPAREDTAGEAGGPGAEDKEGEEPGSSENFHCVNEMERPEELAALEDQSLLLQSQRQYACELCGKPFKHPSNLELHKRSHTGEKPFECNICGKHFSQAGNLQTHLRRHSGEKPYICEVCGKRFAASGDVQRHIIIHSGEKPHLCDICGRGFSNFSNLKEHKKTHTADQLFTCDECGKSFNMQRKLVKHRVRHTGERPYSCSACGKCFGGSGDLRRHVRTHTGEKPYTCEICDKCFTRSAVLRRHRRSHCRADEAAGRDALQALARALQTSGLAGAPLAAAFPRDAPAPAAGKLPGHPVEEAVTAFDGHPAGACGKFRAPAQPPTVGDAEKLSLDPGKVAKAPGQHVPPPAFAYSAADASPGEGLAAGRASLAALDNRCGDPLGGRAVSAAPRSSEGQFFSGLTLWGLAMKTLQNENELDQ